MTTLKSTRMIEKVKLSEVATGNPASLIGLTWSRKNMYYYAPESEMDDEVEEFDWRELALEVDKPVGIVRYKKRSKNSTITNR